MDKGMLFFPKAMIFWNLVLYGKNWYTIPITKRGSWGSKMLSNLVPITQIRASGLIQSMVLLISKLHFYLEKMFGIRASWRLSQIMTVSDGPPQGLLLPEGCSGAWGNGCQRVTSALRRWYLIMGVRKPDGDISTCVVTDSPDITQCHLSLCPAWDGTPPGP